MLKRHRGVSFFVCEKILRRNKIIKKITSQVMSNFKYYGVDQRNTGKTQNNLLSSYPSYGSRVTKEDLAEFNTALNNYAANRQINLAAKEAENQKQQGNKEQNKKPAYVGEFKQNVDNELNKEKTYAYQHISVLGQPTTKNFTKEHLKVDSTSGNTKVKNPVNASEIMNYYYVQNGKFNKDDFNQQMTDYKNYLSKKEELKKQNKTKELEKLEKQNEANVNNLLYSNNSIPGQPTTKNFTKEHLGDAVPEYKDLTTKENEAVSIEQEYSSDPDKEKYIKAGENTASDNTNAGYRYDTNPLKAYRDDSWYLKRGIEQDTRYKRGLDYMNQNEIDTANYILGKYGAKAQMEYLNNIAFRMEQRRANEIYERLENSGALQKGWYALSNGFMSKGKDTIQGIVNTGANKNSFTPSGYEMAVDKARDNASGFEKLYLNGLNDLGEYSFDYIVNPFKKLKDGKSILTKGASIARKLDYANKGKKAEKVINTLKKLDNDVISFEDMYNIAGNTFNVSAKGKKKAEREAFNNGEVISKDKAISEGKKYAGTDLAADTLMKSWKYPLNIHKKEIPVNLKDARSVLKKGAGNVGKYELKKETKNSIKKGISTKYNSTNIKYKDIVKGEYNMLKYKRSKNGRKRNKYKENI